MKSNLQLKNVSQKTFMLLFLIFILGLIKAGPVLSPFIGRIYPVISSIILFVMLILWIKNIHLFKKYLTLKKSTIILLIIILLFSIGVRIYMPYRALWTPDDFWLMDQGKNFLLKGTAEVCHYNQNIEEYCYFMKSTGYPTMLGYVFSTFGLNNFIALYFNSALSILNVLLIFILFYLLTKNEKVSLISVFIFLLSRRYLISSIHVENIIPGLFFIALCYISYFFYFKEKTMQIHILAISSFLLAAFSRVEYVLIIIPIIPLYIKSGGFDKKSFYYPISIMIIILALFSLQVPIISSIGNNSELELSNFIYNIDFLFAGFINTSNIILLALFVLGILHVWKTNKKVLWLSILAIAPAFFLYISWVSPHLTELMILMLIPVYLMVGFGFEKIRVTYKRSSILIFVLLIILLVSFLVSASELKYRIETNEFINIDTLMPEIIESKVPKECFVITERPTFVTATTEVKVIKTLDILDNPYQIQRLLEQDKCLVLYENQFCYQNLGVGPGRDAFLMDSTGRCNFIKENYYLDTFFESNGSEHVYKLHYLKLKN